MGAIVCLVLTFQTSTVITLDSTHRKLPAWTKKAGVCKLKIASQRRNRLSAVRKARKELGPCSDCNKPVGRNAAVHWIDTDNVEPKPLCDTCNNKRVLARLSHHDLREQCAKRILGPRTKRGD